MFLYLVFSQFTTFSPHTVAGSDYSSVNSALLFSASTTRDCANVTILADGLVEPDEMFSIILINTSPDVILNVFMGSVTIVDSDSKLFNCHVILNFVAKNRFFYNLQLHS